MIKIQGPSLLKSIFGFGAGKKPAQVSPSGLKKYSAAISLFDDGDPVVGWYNNQMKLSVDRFQLYKEYDQMDSEDIVCGILDSYAEDACQADITTGRSIWFEAEDAQVERMGNDLLDRIGVEDQIFSIARELSKYGDSFSGITQAVKEDGLPGGIVGLIATTPYVISRVEDVEGRLVGFKIGSIEQMGMLANLRLASIPDNDPPWSIVHFRLLGKNRAYIYGTSFLLGARRAYRRLRMTEDAVTIYRIKRAPDRLVMAIKGLSGMSPEDRASAMRVIRQELRKKSGIDATTGQVKSEFDPLSIDEDLIVDDDSVAITTLRGSQQPGQVLDVDYLRKRFCGTVKIPPDYLGFSDAKGGILGDTPLSYQDINFARMEKRLQRAIMEGFALLFQLELCWSGIDPRSPKAKFTVRMNPVSALDEKQRLELDKVRADTIGTLQQIGSELGLDTDEWTAYLLQRAQIPMHLLRSKEKEVGSKLLRGKISVTESVKKKITEALQKATPTQTALIETLVQRLDYAFKRAEGPNALSSTAVLNSNTPIIEDALKRATKRMDKSDKALKEDNSANLLHQTVKRLDEAKRAYVTKLIEEKKVEEPVKEEEG